MDSARAGASGLVRQADALGAAHAGRERSRPLRSAVLARLLPPHPRRRRLPQRRRHRRLLPDRGPAPPPQRLARATAIRSGRSSPAAARSGCTSSRAPIRTPRATRCGRRIRTGSPSTPTGSRAGTGRTRICGSPARSARTTSSSWTRSTARSSRKYKVDGIFTNRWAPQGGTATACTASGTSRRRPGSSCRVAPTPRIPARRAVHRVAQGAADRAVEALGRDHSRGESRRALHPERSAGPEDGRRARGDPVHRLPGAPRPDAAVGQRPARKEYRSVMGRRPDRRHLQRRPRGAVSLEGLGAERARDPALGRRGHRQRHAAVGHQVLRRALRPALAAGGRAHLRRGTPSTSATCATRCRSPASRCCTRSRPRPYHPGVAPGRSRRRITCSACITRSSRRGCRSRWSTRRSSRPIGSIAFKLLILADAAALSDAQCAAIRAYVDARRQRARDVRVVALRRARAAAARTSAWPTCSACRSPAASTARCRTRI